jgi:hypothetical protein
MPITIKSRQFFFYDEDLAKSTHCISPQKYLPDTKPIENARYRNITFGKGDRAGMDNPCI